MSTIDRAEEKGLIGAIDRAISFSNKGLSPTEAITKVAREEQMTIPLIHRAVEAFNKSKAMFRLKEASADTRHHPFSLADADDVINSIYGSEQKTASAEDSGEPFNPSFSFGIDQMLTNNFQKVASKDDTEKPLSSDDVTRARYKAQMLLKQASVVEAVQSKLHNEVITQKHAFEKAVDRACEIILPMSTREFRKVAQVVVNGYPDTGNKLVNVLKTKTRKDIAPLQKTANAAVFPAREPYLTIGKVYEYAEKLASAENEARLFEKEALNFLTSLSANALANFARPGEQGLGESLQGVGKKKTIDYDEVLDPVFYNRLHELDARRSLMNLVLHDPDLKDYKYSDIVKAFNSSVGSVPEIIDSPTGLKTMVMRNLESSGMKDVVELAQEQQLSQSMAKSKKDRMAVEEAQRPEDEPDPEKREAVAPFSTEQSLKDNLKTTTLSDRAERISKGFGDVKDTGLKEMSERRKVRTISTSGARWQSATSSKAETPRQV
jgi:hypothetical protein